MSLKSLTVPGSIEAFETLWQQGQRTEAVELLRRALSEGDEALARELGDEVLIECAGVPAVRDPAVEQASRLAIALLERGHGPGHRRVWDGMMCLAEYFEKLGDVEGEARVLRDALKRAEALIEVDARPRVETLRRLAALATAQRDVARAEALWRQVVALQEGQETDDGSLSSACGALVALLRSTGRPTDALAFARRRASLAGGRARHDRAIALAQVAELSAEVGSLDEAARLFEQAIAIHGASSRHPHVGRLKGGLAGVRAQQGRLDEARRLYGEAIGVLERPADGQPRVREAQALRARLAELT